MEQALQKCFISISLQVKNTETDFQNLEREREKINKKLRKKILQNNRSNMIRGISYKKLTTEEIHAINTDHHQ